MIGRALERVELAAFLAGGHEGFGIALIDGVVGIGKTTLWEETLGLASEASWRILSARCAQSEVRLTYVALGDLLADVPSEVLDELPPPQSRALEIALLRAELPAEPLAQRTVAAAFLSVVQVLARASPVLIAVDDAQWLDAPSGAVLEFATRRLDREPATLLLTQRIDAPEPFPVKRAAQRFLRLHVEPLSLGALHQLVRASTGVPLPRRRLIELERLSGGNPLFALELVRAGHVDGVAPPLPATLGEAIVSRVRALPDETRKRLLIAALAAGPTSVEPNATALAAAEEAGVVSVAADGAVSFSHPLLAWAILSLASEAEHRQAHLELADRAQSDEEGVRHRALATSGPDAELAVELEQLALNSRARGAPASAAELLAHARRLTAPAAYEDWARRARREIPLLLSAGDCEQAWALGQEALRRLPPGPARAAILLEAAVTHPGATALCEQALAEAGGDAVVTIRAHLLLAMQRLWELDTDGGMKHANIAVERARRHEDLALLDIALTQRAVIEMSSGLDDPRPDLDEALGLERTHAIAPLPVGSSARCCRAVWEIFTGELDSARRTLATLLAQALELADEHSQAQLHSAIGIAELRVGDWRRARQELDEAVALADLMEFAHARGTYRAWLAALFFRQGAFADARSKAEEAIDIGREAGDVVTQVLALAALAHVEVALDDPVSALEHAEGIRRLLPRGAPPPVWLAFEEAEIKALAALGRIAEADERWEALTASGRWDDDQAAAARSHSAVLAAKGDLARAVGELNGLLARRLAPFDEARALLLKGKLERRDKKKAAARDSFGRATSLFELVGAGGWVKKAQLEQSRIGLRKSTHELTETEQRVAQLAAAGRSNREIASALFISRRTVEANIARIYRKLGVNSRAALVRHMGTGDPAPQNQPTVLPSG